MRLEPSSCEPEGPAAWCESIVSGFPWHFCKPAGGCWPGSLHAVLPDQPLRGALFANLHRLLTFYASVPVCLDNEIKLACF